MRLPGTVYFGTVRSMANLLVVAVQILWVFGVQAPLIIYSCFYIARRADQYPTIASAIRISSLMTAASYITFLAFEGIGALIYVFARRQRWVSKILRSFA